MQYLAERVYEAPSANVSVHAMYENYRNWFTSTGLRGQLGRKQFANRVEAADIAKSSRRSQGYFFMNVNLGAVRRMRTRIRLQAQPEPMRSIVGATQQEQRFD